MSGLRFNVADLVDKPGERRSVSGVMDLALAVGESRIDDVARVEAVVEGIDEGVLARFRASVDARLVCTRCLTEWQGEIEASAVQVYEPDPDEDGYGLAADATIDLSGPVRDEIALAVPVRLLCSPDCAGLCPKCGTDLNREPCGGHDEPSSSPFAALQGLFDSPDP